MLLGRGGVLGQGKGSGSWVKKRFNGNISGYWVWKRLMSQLCWQHAKIIFPNKNPLERSNSYAHEGGIDLDPAQSVKAIQTVKFSFLNSQETPFQE